MNTERYEWARISEESDDIITSLQRDSPQTHPAWRVGQVFMKDMDEDDEAAYEFLGFKELPLETAGFKGFFRRYTPKRLKCVQCQTMDSSGKRNMCKERLTHERSFEEDEPDQNLGSGSRRILLNTSMLNSVGEYALGITSSNKK